MTLRPYQQRDIGRIREAFGRSRSVLYVLPTGGGKTHIFVEVAERVVSRGGNVLVLEHRGELVAQAVRKLREVGINPGVVSASIADAEFTGFERVVVATVQTAVGFDFGHWQPTFVIADEAHLAASATWRQLLLQRFGDCWRLGVTATPERLDGQGLGDLFREMVVGPTIAELTAAGHLVPSAVYSSHTPVDLANVRMRAGEFVAADLGDLLGSPALTGDVVDHYERLGGNRQAIIYATTVDHAMTLWQEFMLRDYSAAVVTGKTPRKLRDAILGPDGSMAAGNCRVLVNVGVTIEGFDCPPVSYIGFARITASLTVALQAIGRGLRPSPGKTDCIIADHGGNFAHRFGLPDQDRTWSLAGRAKRVRGVDPEAVAVATCDKCLALYQRAPCPRCGHTPMVTPRALRQVGGLLRPLTKAEITELRRNESKRMPPRPPPSWAPPALWERMEAIRHANGYEPKWTIMACKRNGRVRR